MANQNQSLNENISEVLVNVTVSGLKRFKEFESDLFYVNGNPWHIRFAKVKDCGKDWLGVYLHSDLVQDSNDTLIVATSDVILLSSKVTVKSHQENIYLDAFCAENSCWGLDSFIAWAHLVNPNNGYIVGDSCEFQVRVKATALLIAAENEWCKFDSNVKCECEGCSHRKFRLTIRQFQNSIGVCSPIIYFNGSSWRIVVGRKGDQIVVTICKTGDRSCLLTSTIKLLSFDPNIQPIEKGTDDQEFDSDGSYGNWDLITWDRLIDPRKKFIQDDAFVIEMELKAGRGKSAPKKRRTEYADDDATSLRCFKCKESLAGCPISSLLCGDLMCTACATDVLRKENKCPICGVKSTVADLRSARLPPRM